MAAARGINQLLRRTLHSQSSVRCLDFGAKDLASDEALWALYERWHRVHGRSLYRGEMARRFNTFKANARFVHDFNQRGESFKVCLNKFADLTLNERKRLCGARKEKIPRVILSKVAGEDGHDEL